METHAKRPIVVPWDFTEVAGYALDHAINLAKLTHTVVMLLHIVKKEKEKPDAGIKLEETRAITEKENNIKVLARVEEGNIFHTISEVANHVKAEMVIMGTHGIKGMQKFVGSWALKVIAGTKVPFIVVQDKMKSEGFRDIVFPIDYRIENREKINWIYFIHRLYNSKFHVFRGKFTDSKFKRGVQSNIHFTKKFLDNNEIPHEWYSAEGKRDFAHETIEFAHQINADLILVLTTKNISLADYVLGANEQQIISNKYGIPVMCINPKPGKISSGFRATGSA